jgi:phytoene dehydrogenase-like protein
MYDTIIIGAGMSGLAAGIRLAHYDRKVCILERHKVIGGLNSFYRVGNRNFDVGLHAVTNFTPKGTRRGPMARMLRQLRIRWDEFSLSPQLGSEIAFPDARLRFSNDHRVFESEIAAKFPKQIDNYRKFLDAIVDYERLGTGDSGISAREMVSRYITDPLLVEMIFCPILFYGGAQEHDMDFHQFSIMFRAIFLEGLARPTGGVRLILRQLVKRFKNLGGELRLRAGVREICPNPDQEAVEKVILDDGTELTAKHVLSSAGWHETMQLCDHQEEGRLEGGLSFVESISVLNRQPKSLGHDRTIVFFNDSEKFDYRDPHRLVDARSGVICSPNNFIYDKPLAEGMMRITSLANYEHWKSLDEDAYRVAKLRCYDQTVAAATRFVPDFRSSVIETDVFTPTTIKRFTGHQRGTVYGAPKKQYSGRTHLKNLFICGTDQGFVGIIGALVSGITVANQYMLD